MAEGKSGRRSAYDDDDEERGGNKRGRGGQSQE